MEWILEECNQDGKSKQKGQEDTIFLVRYMYYPQKVNANSREFCKKMVAKYGEDWDIDDFSNDTSDDFILKEVQ